ncbi:MAG: hypothetical protein US63_C0022G0011 [Candidatus Moranbacteria bacterium GW2011_GWC2_37_8]|nr:MAG: hypothetical protein US63_C0022G0011 [Candidatus Moranbacteria bacterium GW2011_GWC2_37_8]
MKDNEKYQKYVQQKMELLILNPFFQAEVIKARKQLHIPVDGFGNEKEKQAWLKKRLLIAERKTKQRQEYLQSRKISMYEFMDKANQVIVPKDAIVNVVKEIVSKFESSKIIRHGLVATYLLFNRIEENNELGNIRFLNDSLVFSKEVDTQGKAHIVAKKFSYIDIEKIKSQNKAEEGSKKRKRLSEKFEMNKKIYIMNTEKNRHRRIASIINKEFGTSFFYYDIPKIVARFKEKIMDI